MDGANGDGGRMSRIESLTPGSGRDSFRVASLSRKGKDFTPPLGPKDG